MISTAMQLRTKIAVCGTCILCGTYAAWLMLPDPLSLTKSILRDVAVVGWLVVGLLSVFATPAGYSDEEQKTSPSPGLWWTYLLLVPSIALGLMSFFCLLYWI